MRIYAKLINYVDLSDVIKKINNGRNDGVSFHQSGSIISVSIWYEQMNIEQQKKELKWLLSGLNFELINETK